MWRTVAWWRRVTHDAHIDVIHDGKSHASCTAICPLRSAPYGTKTTHESSAGTGTVAGNALLLRDSSGREHRANASRIASLSLSLKSQPQPMSQWHRRMDSEAWRSELSGRHNDGRHAGRARDWDAGAAAVGES
jgi:hypothetical protein